MHFRPWKLRPRRGTLMQERLFSGLSIAALPDSRAKRSWCFPRDRLGLEGCLARVCVSELRVCFLKSPQDRVLHFSLNWTMIQSKCLPSTAMNVTLFDNSLSLEPWLRSRKTVFASLGQ